MKVKQLKHLLYTTVVYVVSHVGNETARLANNQQIIRLHHMTVIKRLCAYILFI